MNRVKVFYSIQIKSDEVFSFAPCAVELLSGNNVVYAMVWPLLGTKGVERF